jgi:peptidoglycan/xylan/chitin deacetylase (PgdA/CDA1 family)
MGRIAELVRANRACRRQNRTLPLRLLAVVTLMGLFCVPGRAEDCPGNPHALGTSRVLEVDAATTPRVGRKQFEQTLPLEPKEVVITFDDGPWPATTPRVLDALRHECVRATFFLVGRNAAAAPALVRREQAEGHTIASHTWSHPMLDRRYPESAEGEIERGIDAVDAALGRRNGPAPTTRFFRFPGFASTPQLLDLLARRGIVVFGADLWASDWDPMTPSQELRLVLDRLAAADHGIILLHDTKAATAAMLPAFLRALKIRGYHIVHTVPAAPAH